MGDTNVTHEFNDSVQNDNGTLDKQGKQLGSGFILVPVQLQKRQQRVCSE